MKRRNFGDLVSTPDGPGFVDLDHPVSSNNVSVYVPEIGTTLVYPRHSVSEVQDNKRIRRNEPGKDDDVLHEEHRQTIDELNQLHEEFTRRDRATQTKYKRLESKAERKYAEMVRNGEDRKVAGREEENEIHAAAQQRTEEMTENYRFLYVERAKIDSGEKERIRQRGLGKDDASASTNKVGDVDESGREEEYRRREREANAKYERAIDEANRKYTEVVPGGADLDDAEKERFDALKSALWQYIEEGAKNLRFLDEEPGKNDASALTNKAMELPPMTEAELRPVNEVELRAARDYVHREREIHAKWFRLTREANRKFQEMKHTGANRKVAEQERDDAKHAATQQRIEEQSKSRGIVEREILEEQSKNRRILSEEQERKENPKRYHHAAMLPLVTKYTDLYHKGDYEGAKRIRMKFEKKFGKKLLPSAPTAREMEDPVLLAKVASCVRQMKKSGRSKGYNPWAVCRASVEHRGGTKENPEHPQYGSPEDYPSYGCPKLLDSGITEIGYHSWFLFYNATLPHPTIPGSMGGICSSCGKLVKTSTPEGVMMEYSEEYPPYGCPKEGGNHYWFLYSIPTLPERPGEMGGICTRCYKQVAKPFDTHGEARENPMKELESYREWEILRDTGRRRLIGYPPEDFLAYPPIPEFVESKTLAEIIVAIDTVMGEAESQGYDIGPMLSIDSPTRRYTWKDIKRGDLVETPDFVEGVLGLVGSVFPPDSVFPEGSIEVEPADISGKVLSEPGDLPLTLPPSDVIYVHPGNVGTNPVNIVDKQSWFHLYHKALRAVRRYQTKKGVAMTPDQASSIAKRLVDDYARYGPISFNLNNVARVIFQLYPGGVIP